MTRYVSRQSLSEATGKPSPVVTFPSEEGPPRPDHGPAGARPCYHPLPPGTKRERGARGTFDIVGVHLLVFSSLVDVGHGLVG